MVELLQQAKCKFCAAALAMFHFMVTRLAQPSTWVAIASALTLAHLSIDPSLWQHIVDAAIAVSSLAGFILNERGVKVMQGQQELDGTKPPQG